MVIACVPKHYDLGKIESKYPNESIYVTSNVEGRDKVLKFINGINKVVYDENHMDEDIESYVAYATKLHFSVDELSGDLK